MKALFVRLFSLLFGYTTAKKDVSAPTRVLPPTIAQLRDNYEAATKARDEARLALAKAEAAAEGKTLYRFTGSFESFHGKSHETTVLHGSTGDGRGAAEEFIAFMGSHGGRRAMRHLDMHLERWDAGTGTWRPYENTLKLAA